MTAPNGAPTPYPELAEVLAHLPLLLREARRARGLSQRAASDQLGFGFTTVSRIEAGHDCVMSNVIAILRWLDAPTPSAELVQVDPDPFDWPFITEVEPGTVVTSPNLAFGEPVTIETVGEPWGQFPKVHVVFRRDPDSQISDSVDLPADTAVTIVAPTRTADQAGESL